MSTPEHTAPDNSPKREHVGATKSPLLTPSPVQRELLELEKVVLAKKHTDNEEEYCREKYLEKLL